jgi:hypothetical protein
MIPAPVEISLLAKDLYETRKAISELETKELALANQIKYAIGTNDGIADRTFKATWKAAKEGRRIDWEGLVKSMNINPDLIAEFSKPSGGGRRFLFNYFDGE